MKIIDTITLASAAEKVITAMNERIAPDVNSGSDIIERYLILYLFSKNINQQENHFRDELNKAYDIDFNTLDKWIDKNYVLLTTVEKDD
jgi:hypothetical protein